MEYAVSRFAIKGMISDLIDDEKAISSYALQVLVQSLTMIRLLHPFDKQ